MDREPGNQRNFSKLPDWSAERQYFGRFYQSQGFAGKQVMTNDCGPASLAAALNLLFFQANLGAEPLEKDAVIQSARMPFWERLPAWVPKVGGATTPWGMAGAFNRLAAVQGLAWRAERRSNARRAHIIEALVTGRLVSALKIWKTGGAHWVTLVRYAGEKDRLYYLDPNPFLEFLPQEKRLQSQSWAEFAEAWSRETWWSRLLGIRNEIVVYSRSA